MNYNKNKKQFTKENHENAFRKWAQKAFRPHNCVPNNDNKQSHFPQWKSALSCSAAGRSSPACAPPPETRIIFDKRSFMKH